MKAHLLAFLKQIRKHKMMLANIAAIVLAYVLMQRADTKAERELLEAICTVLGLTGTALVRSIMQTKPPK